MRTSDESLTTIDVGGDEHIYQPDTARRGPALAAMFAAGFLFAVMGLAAKITHDAHLVGRTMPASEVTVFRFAFGALVMLPLQGRRGIQLLGNDRWGLLKRGAWGALAVFFYFLSLQSTSLTHAQLLNYASIVFAPLFAFAVLREQITGRMVSAIFIAVAGICLITLQSYGSAGLNVGDAYGLLSGILAGAAVTEIRRLRQNESAWSVFFYLCIVGTPVACAGAWVLGDHFILPTAAGLGALLMMAVSSVAAQILLTYGFKYVRAGEGSLIAMSQIVYNAVAGAIFFHEALTAWTVAGAVLIVGAALWLSAKC